MAIWYLSTATANKFAGTLSGYYPQPLIEVADVKAAAEKSMLKLLPENFEKSVSEKNGVEVMPFDKIAFSEIKDKNLKEEIQRELEPKQMENPKTFLGYQISNLYDFFMLFVFMAGGQHLLYCSSCPAGY